MRRIVIHVLALLLVTLEFTSVGSGQSYENPKDSVMHLIVKYLNLGLADSASMVAESHINHSDFVNDREYWYYRGVIYRELYNKHEKGEKDSQFRERATLSFQTALRIEGDASRRAEIFKSLKYLATTYYNDAAKLLQLENTSTIWLSTHLYERYIEIMKQVESNFNEKEKLVAFYNTVGASYSRMFESADRDQADAYYKLAKQNYFKAISLDSLDKKAQYNVLVLETNYKTKTERLLKVEAVRKDSTIYSLNAVNELAEAKLRESQLQEEAKKKELIILKNRQEQDKLQAQAEQESLEAEKQRQQIILWSVIAGLLLVVVFAGLILKSYRKVQRGHQIITYQKERVEKSYQNTKLLSEIGQQITASLSVHDIIDQTYENINKLMDASILGVFLINEEEHRLESLGLIEKGEEMPSAHYDLGKTNRPAVKCFENQIEVLMNDYRKDWKKYFPSETVPPPIAGAHAESLIYLPLSTSNKRIGVITVQSFEKYMYSEYHVDILKNLAVYVVTALENARLYTNVEEEVKLRTKEVIAQKEEIEKSYQNTKLLSEIGQKITASLFVNNMIEKVYESVNELMDASVLAMGIYDANKNELCFPGDIERGEKLPYNAITLNKKESLSVTCFKEGTEIFINDLDTEYKKYVSMRSKSVVGDDTVSLIYVPLFVKENPIGVITVQSFEKNAYQPYHVDILRNLSVYVATALENARLYGGMEDEVKERTTEVVKQKEELEEKAKELQKSYQNITVLSEMGQNITSKLSIEDIIVKVYENVHKLMGASSFGIGVYNKEKHRLDFPNFIENGKPCSFHYEALDTSKTMAAYCFTHQEEIVIGDLTKEYIDYFPNSGVPKRAHDELAESLIYLPLVYHQKKIGVITVQSTQKNTYTNLHVEILKSLAVYVGVALNNAEAYKKLNLAFEELKQTQMQLIQSEKMAALGQLIAGVAHEINTPMGVIRSSVNNISQVLKLVLQALPEFFKGLSTSQHMFFFEVMEQSLKKDNTISTREERLYRKEITKVLAEANIDEADTFADTLVDMGIYEVNTYLSQLQEEKSKEILEVAYKLSGMQRSTESITTASDRASKIVFALKNFVHFDSSGEKTKAEIRDGIETVLSLYHNLLKQGVEVVRDFSDSTPEIFCFPDELNQVWTNLIHNALQAMDGQGTIEIAVVNSLLPESRADCIKVSITDSGKGIPAEIKDKIFNPFFTTKKVGEGSGLGLDIVKKIIDKHEGVINFESTPGKTQFNVFLPVIENNVVSTESSVYS